MAVMKQEFKVGPRGMDTRAMVEAQHRVGCIGSKAEWGGWEALVHEFDDTSIPILLLYVSTFSEFYYGFDISHSWLEILSRCRKWRVPYFNQRIQR